jgi:hypothetical protein
MRVANAGESTLIGRVDEIARIHALLQPGASTARPLVALVEGEPGIGKTRLLAETTRREIALSGGSASKGADRPAPDRCASEVELWPVAQLG